MKKMKKILKRRVLFVSAIVFGLFLIGTADVSAQKTKRSRTAAEDSTNAAELRKGAEDVAIQIKNISKFVFLLGGVAKGIEDIDKEVRAGRASREIERQNEEFKSNVNASIRGIRAGLVRLEIDFRTKPALKKYLVHIQGISDQTARAEDFAYVGQFNNAGKELLIVLETLTDTLVEMP